MKKFQFPSLPSTPEVPRGLPGSPKYHPPPPLDLSRPNSRPIASLSHPSFPFAPGSPEPSRSTGSRLAPLPRYDPYVRPRADSLSAVIEDDRGAFEPPSPDSPVTPTTPRSRQQFLRRMATVDNIHAKINRDARNLGLRTTLDSDEIRFVPPPRGGYHRY